jgi:NADH oxidase (H2O2-forming)
MIDGSGHSNHHARGRTTMQNYDVLIIGASAAGLTAALTARRHYPGKSIAVLRSKQLVPIPCGIPYAFGVVGTPERNLIPADDLLSKNGITSVVGKAKEIDREAQQVLATSGEVFGYERLVIAVGSAPIIPPIPGVDQENVFAIKKDVPYLKEIASALDKAKNLCIIGGGFIGVEIAEECRRRRPDLGISIVEMRDHCLQLVYDGELSVQAEEILREQGISLVLGERVEALVGGGVVRGIRLASGRHVDADVVILGIGAMPSVSVAEAAGLEIGPTKGIQVNRYMQTTDPRIFACGDCAEKLSFFDGMPSGLKLASIAATEARIVGANLFRTSRVNPGVIGIYSTVLGDCAFAAAGLTQAAAIEKGYDVVVGESESVNRHPGCMPGACQLKVKLVFEAGSQVLIGGQVTGARSGGELINTIGACIHRRMTADDIATFQAGTHPALTASPVSYQLANAAEVAIQKVNALVGA